MATAAEHRVGTDATREVLERIAGGEHGAKLRSQVAGWNPGATVDQVEEAFQEACARADQLCVGQSEGEVFVWLRTTTHRELGRMRRRVERELLVDVSSPAFARPDRSSATPPEELIEREDEAEIARLARAVLDQLSERQREVAALHSHGLRRNEIAERLGVSPRVVKRSLEQILAAGREQLLGLAGHGCDAGERLVARYTFGLATEREARQAQVHLATCPRCGAMYERLDLWREKVATLLPVPAAVHDHAGSVERLVHTGADLVSGHDGHHRTAAARRQLADLVAGMRDHATSAYYRTVDPTPLAGVRPGAVAATIAGCLAIGGGATYCVQQGVDPIASIVGDRPAKPEAGKQTKRAHAARAVAAVSHPTPPVVSAPAPATASSGAGMQTHASAQRSAQAQTARRRAKAQASSLPPAPQDEFEPTSSTASSGGGGGSAVTASAASINSNTSVPSAPTTPPKRAKPAAAPAGGPGEFDGP